MSGSLREIDVLLHFSIPALLASALVSPAMWLCNAWLAREPNGYAELGIYAAADRWRLAILFIPTSLSAPVLSMLANFKGNADERSYRKVFLTSLKLMGVFVSVIGLLSACIAPFLMRSFGPAYRDGWKVLSILSLSAIAEALNTFLGQPLVTRSMWRRFGFDAVLVSVLLGSAWFLIPRWRGMGLAEAYALAFVMTSLLLSAYQWRRGLFR
jgi:O-antigen/teichoic acid export membrane protein